MRRRNAGMLLLLVLALGCAGRAPPEEVPPGRVWITGSTVTVLSSQGWRTFDDRTSPLDLAAGGQGQVWLAHHDQVLRFDGREFQVLPDCPGASELALDAQGRLWAALLVGYTEQVECFDGTQWTPFHFGDHGQPAFERASISDLAVDGRGHVWALADEGLLEFDGQAWTAHRSIPDCRISTISTLGVDEQGGLWAVHSQGASRFDGSTWSTWPAASTGQAGDLAFDGSGRAWLASYAGLLLFDGGTWTRYDASNSGLVNDQVHAVAIDGQGRVWAGTRYGVSVFDGAEWITYDQSNSGLADNDIRQIVIDGGGLASLPALEEVRVGELQGTITQEGAPVAGAQVLLCSGVMSLGWFSGENPCTGPFQREAATDSAGSFAFAAVPIGKYALAIHTAEGGWLIPLAGGGPLAQEFAITEGATTRADLDIAP